MTPEHLLPANATRLEIALSEASAYASLLLPIEAIRRFKTEPADPLLPWLIWEYGLEELLPYLAEPRRAIAEGVQWQRLRGTPKALEIALGWIGAGVVTVEQEEAGSVHWAEFQIDPGRWLDWDEVGRVIAVAKLSAPARSRLARLFHGYDVRRVKLDVSRLDEALLSDYSGTVWADGVTRLSFGRLWQEIADADAARALPDAQRLAAHARYGRYADRCLLSEMRFGCRPVPNPALEVSSAHEKAHLLGVLGLAGLLPERRFAKAQIVLSETWPLGATTACTPPRVWQPGEAEMRFGDPLSAGIGAGRWLAITERFDVAHDDALAIACAVMAAQQRHVAHRAPTDRHLRLSDLMLSAERSGYLKVGARREIARASKRAAQINALAKRRFAKAQIVLSEAWPLGETNACTPVRIWQPADRPLRFGDPLSAGIGVGRMPARIWQPADRPMRFGDALSSGIGAGRWLVVTERLEAEYDDALAASRADRQWRLSDLMLSEEMREGFAASRSATHADAAALSGLQSALDRARVRDAHIERQTGRVESEALLVHPRHWPLSHAGSAQLSACAVRHGAVAYRGQRWAGRWQARSWTQARECLQSQHTSTVE